MQRRDFLALGAAGGGAVFMSALAGCASRTDSADGGLARADDVYFVQLSDSHWGYSGPANPDAAVTLPKAVAAVQALPTAPDFIVFTGDLTHTTDDPAERRRRLASFKRIVSVLEPPVYFLAGEHDASLDRGEAFRALIGPTFYAFDHKGVHFIALDNVSDPGGRVDVDQLAWLKADLAGLRREQPIVVITHRPLFDLAPQWDWATRNGREVVDVLLPYPHVTVFYGHIHQTHHHMTGHIAHHAAQSLIFPLPAPGSQDKRLPVPWDPSHPYKGLGFREIEADVPTGETRLTEHPLGEAS